MVDYFSHTHLEMFCLVKLLSTISSYCPQGTCYAINGSFPFASHWTTPTPTTSRTTTTTTTTTTTKPFVPSVWGRLHEPKENYAGSGT